jgi:hypothetical protein
MKYCLLFACCCLSFLTHAQSPSTPVQIDDRLYEIYEEDYLSRLLQERPFLIQRWNFYLDHAYYLTNSEKALSGDYPTIVVKDTETINILSLMQAHQLVFDPKVETAYRIAGEEQVLVIQSSKRLIAALNKHLGRTLPK